VARGLLDRAWRPILVRLVVVAAAAVALTVAILFASGGSIGFQGASGNGSYASFGHGVDPTASLLAGTVRHSPTDHGHWYVRPEAIMRDFAESATTVKSAPAWLVWLVPVAVVGAAVVILLRF